MTYQDLNSSDHTPEDIRWQDGRNPERPWAITRKQPVASLLVAGALWGFCRRTPPPRELIGRRLIITAGVSHEPFKGAGETGWAAMAAHAGISVSPAEIPSGRERIFREAVKALPYGETVGSAQLTAAFKIHRVYGGRVFTNLSPGKGYAPPPVMGRWREFEAQIDLPIVEALTPGEWMWCFEEPHAFAEDVREKIKGFGGIWDLDGGLKLRGAL
jgi:hypothetical protein